MDLSPKTSSEKNNINPENGYFFDENDMEINIAQYERIDFIDLFSHLEQIQNKSHKEKELNFLSLFLKNRISENFSNHSHDIITLFQNSSPEEQININNTLYFIFTYSSHRHLQQNLVEHFSSPSNQDISELFINLRNNAKNQFILYTLNSTLSHYIDINDSDDAFSNISNKLYNKYKVVWENIYFKGKQFWSILQLSKDYLTFTSKDTAEWLSKITPNILEISEESEAQNNNYFLYDGILDSYITHSIWEKNHHKFQDYKNDNIRIAEDFKLWEYSNEVISKMFVYLFKYWEDKINYLLPMCVAIFWKDNSSQIFNTFIEIYNHLEIKNSQDILQNMRIFRDNNIKDPIILNIMNKMSWFIDNSTIRHISDKRASLTLENYEDIIKKETGIFHNWFPSEKTAQYIKSLHTPKFIQEIQANLWCDITQLLLSNQVYFFHFLWNKSPWEFQIFKDTLSKQKNKLAFINSFLACSKTPEIWDKILELAQHEGSEEIFEAYAELINLQSEIDSEDIDLLTFLRSTISRWEKLLLEALQKAKNWENLSIDKKYSSKLVRSWSFVKALISKNKKWLVLEKNEFNEKCPYYNIETFSWWDNFIQSDDKLDLLSKENYIFPEVFSKDDYLMIVNNLKEAYHEIDPQWLNILIANISEDLQNPDVRFYMMRDKNTKKLVSLCKSNKWIHEWELYLGTHYVEQDLRWDFGFWDYVLKLAIQENQNIDTLTGCVAVNNPHLERHINYWGFSASQIVFDTDMSWNSSWELFKLDFNKHSKYRSKNKINYSDEDLKQLSWQSENNNIIVYKCDSQSWNDQEFKDICNGRFNNWYVLTRLVYEKSWNNPDLSQTYITFEKNEEL